jgi:glycosyltransferase involved in cell wall biosynthesis
MKVGLIVYHAQDVSDSIAYVRSMTASALRTHHTLQPYPEAYPFASPREQRELLKGWIAGCDAIVGPVDETILQVRQEIDRAVPYVCFLLGCMSRGGTKLGVAHRYLRTFDVLTGNCEADVELAAKFFPNATVRSIPLPYEASSFYPEDEAVGQRTRAALGIDPAEQMLLYSGRITLEKNVQTLLKTFKVVLNARPATRLVIAGEPMQAAFGEFGAMPLGIGRSLQRLAAHLGFDANQVLFIGRRSAEQLRALYSTADVLVNLTLHHDENFGLAQIEAMACGLPTVGAEWGGLKDTIVEGVTGAQVPAVVTPIGVKVDWWQAANRIVDLLDSGGEAPRLRARCAARTRERYSIDAYAESLDGLLREAIAAAAGTSEPVRLSDFAEEYWIECMGNRDGRRLGGSRPPYRQSAKALHLYRDLITPFASAPANGASSPAPLWCLASPLSIHEDDRIAVNDPLYPFMVPIPEELVSSVRVLVSRFAAHAVLSTAAALRDTSAAADALAWMHDTGLLLRTSPGTLDPECAHGALGQPIFVLREIDSRTDVVWFS